MSGNVKLVLSMRLLISAPAALSAAFLVDRRVKWQRATVHQLTKMADENVNLMPGLDTKKPFTRVLLGGGCFWGVEKLVREEFRGKLRGTAVGYAGGHKKNPTYEEVCTGNTGHCEVVYVQFYEEQLPLEDVLGFYWSIHDPTTPNRQGNDVGTQYRSALFLYSPVHKEIAERVREKMQKKWDPKKITTDILGPEEWSGHFWPAEAYHQVYLEKNPGLALSLSTVTMDEFDVRVIPHLRAVVRRGDC